MPVSFTIKTKTPSAGSAAKHISNAKQAVNGVVEAIESTIGNIVSDELEKLGEASNRRKIYIASIFFQMVVASTPVDGPWTDSKGRTHKPDDDVVRDDWHIAYGRTDLCAKDFQGCFETVYDEGAIRKIASALLDRVKTEKHIRTFRVYNTNPRFSELEYGEYKLSGGEIKSGTDGRKHGVVNHFSVQAPEGMLRITEAKIDWIVQASKKLSGGLLAKAQDSLNSGGGTKKTKKRKNGKNGKAVYSYLKRKRKFTEADLQRLTT
jgi:hypothetical protein